MIQAPRKFLAFIPVVFTVVLFTSPPVHTQSVRQVSMLVSATYAPSETVLSWVAPSGAQPAIVSYRNRLSEVFRTDTLGVPDVQPTVLRVPRSDQWQEVAITQLWRVNNADFLATSYVVLDRGLQQVELPHGFVLLIVDSELYTELTSEIATLAEDVELEGWEVVVQPTAPSASVAEVKQVISENTVDRLDNALPPHVLLLGSIAYPYSGGYSVQAGVPNPDFHTEHGGAWVADSYYADVVEGDELSDPLWTDFEVNIADPDVAARDKNKNVPGDGKFDQHLLPSDLDVCVGRVTFSNLPAFGTSNSDRQREVELYKQYLDRNHAYRTRSFQPPARAIIDDNFGTFTRIVLDTLRATEAFASSGFRSFSAIVGSENVFDGDWIADEQRSRVALDSFECTFAYGCGGGGYAHCTGVGTAGEFATATLKAPFTMLFGSYFGDIDSDNNMLRSVIATDGWALTCGWAGRPHWYMHGLAAGETIGQSQLRSANADTNYIASHVIDIVTKDVFAYTLGVRNIHTLLVGDPTLRLQGPTLKGELKIADTQQGTHIIEFARSSSHTDSTPVGYHLEAKTSAGYNHLATILPTSNQVVSSTVTLPAGVEELLVRPYFANSATAGVIAGRGIRSSTVVVSVREHSPEIRLSNVVVCDLAGSVVGVFSGTRSSIDKQVKGLNLANGSYVAGSPNGDSWKIVVAR